MLMTFIIGGIVSAILGVTYAFYLTSLDKYSNLNQNNVMEGGFAFFVIMVDSVIVSTIFSRCGITSPIGWLYCIPFLMASGAAGVVIGSLQRKARKHPASLLSNHDISELIAVLAEHNENQAAKALKPKTKAPRVVQHVVDPIKEVAEPVPVPEVVSATPEVKKEIPKEAVLYINKVRDLMGKRMGIQ